METSNWSVLQRKRLITNFFIFFSQWALFGLINSFILEPVFIRDVMSKIIEFIKIVQNFYYLLSKGKVGVGKKRNGADWETFSLIWTKDPCIMQSTKNRETDAKGYWDILDSGTISSFILVLSWHQSLLMHLYSHNSVFIFYSIYDI